MIPTFIMSEEAPVRPPGLLELALTFNKIALASFGGGLSAFWAATTSTPVASVVMLAPVIDYVEDVLGQHGAIEDGKLSKSHAKSLAENGFIEMDGFPYGAPLVNEVPFISGIEGLRRLTRPSLIIHGDADSIVPYESSKRFVKLNRRCRLVNKYS